MLVEVLVDVWLGVGAPGESSCPAKVDTARTAVTITTAHIRRNLVSIFQPPTVFHYFVNHGKIQDFLHQPNFCLAGLRKLR
jgi:hypothetical protein